MKLFFCKFEAEQALIYYKLILSILLFEYSMYDVMCDASLYSDTAICVKY